MAFWGFRNGGLIFWAILLDLIAAIVDFAVLYEKYKQEKIFQKKVELKEKSELANLEKRSRALELELLLLKQKLAASGEKQQP